MFNFDTQKQLKEHLRTVYGVNTVLSGATVNKKIEKNITKAKVLTNILYLLPEKQAPLTIAAKYPELMKFEVFKKMLSSINFCLFAGSCTNYCLNGSGNPAYLKPKYEARLNRSKLYIFNSELFMQVLFIESIKHYRQFLASYKDRNYLCGLRLNGTSDLLFEKSNYFHCKHNVIVNDSLSNLIYKLTNIRIKTKNYSTIFEAFKQNDIDINVYDYTKHHKRNIKNLNNYHLTYSYDPKNIKHLNKVNNLNIAVAFSRDSIINNELPKHHKINNIKLKVVDGDNHDFRPFDDKDYQGIKVIGLKEKRITDKKQVSKQTLSDRAFFLDANYDL